MAVNLAETQQTVKGLTGEMHELRADLRETKKVLNKLSFQIGRLDGRLSGMVTGIGGEFDSTVLLQRWRSPWSCYADVRPVTFVSQQANSRKTKSSTFAFRPFA